MSGERVIAYRCAPTIAWVKDADRILLVEEETARSWSIDGVEAVIWDLLTLSYPFERLTHFLSVLLGKAREEATNTLWAVVQEWEAAGIVQAVWGNGCDESGDQCCM